MQSARSTFRIRFPADHLCISPDDPIIKHIKEGQKVTYDLMRGDNGQLYAVDIRLAQDEDIARPARFSVLL